jgi:hypothetical protein
VTISKEEQLPEDPDETGEGEIDFEDICDTGGVYMKQIGAQSQAYRRGSSYAAGRVGGSLETQETVTETESYTEIEDIDEIVEDLRDQGMSDVEINEFLGSLFE